MFDTQKMTTQELYRLLVGGVTPRPIAWISTLSETGVANIAPYSFFTVASVNPPVLCYTQVNPQSGQDKDTLNNLLATKECVVHIVDQAHLEKMNLTCAALLPSQSEFEFANLAHEESHTVAPWSVIDAPVRYECTLRDIVRINELPGGGTMVLLDVKHIHVRESLLKDGSIEQQQLDSVGKMGGDFYSTSVNLIKLSRPT